MNSSFQLEILSKVGLAEVFTSLCLIQLRADIESLDIIDIIEDLNERTIPNQVILTTEGNLSL